MKLRETLGLALLLKALLALGAATVRTIAVAVTVASLALGTARCQGSPPPTTEFAVSDHGVVRGSVAGASGQPLTSANVMVRFPGIAGGISSPVAATDSNGQFEMTLRVFGRGGSIPLTLDSLPAFVVGEWRGAATSGQIV